MGSRCAALVGVWSGFALLTACGSSISSPSDGSSGVQSFTGGAPQLPAASAARPTTPAGTPSNVGSTSEEVTTAALLPSAMPEAAPEAAWSPPTTIEPSSPVGTHGQLHVQGTQLVDAKGAAVQLKGISSMWLNWEDRYSTSKPALQWMRDTWHVSVFRAAMGVEPDNAYLAEPDRMLSVLRQVVHNAIDLGVYVIIDWHDHHAHQHTAQAVDFFGKIAAEFGTFPNVLYETFNEPEADPDWSKDIKPYHQAAVAAIRAQDPDGVVILGTRQWSQRVDEAAKDPLQGANLMYTVHFYACDHKATERGYAQTAYAAGLPIFVTEWGATPADGGAANPTVCADDAQAWHDWMNQEKISWAAWKLDGCKDSSCILKSEDAPVDGGWTDQWLNGHGPFVVQKLMN